VGLYFAQSPGPGILTGYIYRDIAPAALTVAICADGSRKALEHPNQQPWPGQRNLLGGNRAAFACAFVSTDLKR
jgi:hypothetical protein